jgi:hypothetical protein
MFNHETTMLHPLMASPGPSESQKDDSALVAPEHCHRAYAAPDNVSPVPPENHEADAAPDNLADPSENQEAEAATNSSPNPPAARPRRARAAPYPTRPASSAADGYPSSKTLRPKVSTTISDYCNPKLTIWRFQSLCSISK